MASEQALANMQHEVAVRALQAIASTVASGFTVPLVRSISGNSVSSTSAADRVTESNEAAAALVRTSSRSLDGEIGALISDADVCTPETDDVKTLSFGVQVWSVEDACNKEIAGLRREDTLASLLEKIRGEFLVPGKDDINLSLGKHVFTAQEFGKAIGVLGIDQESWLSFSMVEQGYFSVEVSNMAGSVNVQVTDLQPDMNLASLVSAVEKEMGIIGEEAVRLVFGDRSFGVEDLPRRLSDIGITDGMHLMSITESRLKGSCPKCHRTHGTGHDVTAGGMHEGWGRRWNKCDYNCYYCGGHIQNSTGNLHCCILCKGFWHKSCRSHLRQAQK